MNVDDETAIKRFLETLDALIKKDAQPETYTWTETTPRGPVTVTFNWQHYLIDGCMVPAERYIDAITTGIW